MQLPFNQVCSIITISIITTSVGIMRLEAGGGGAWLLVISVHVSLAAAVVNLEFGKHEQSVHQN